MTEEKFDGDVPGGLQSFWLDQIKELQKDNSLQKDLAEKRDNMLFDYGNKVVECNSLESLYKLKVSVKRFKTITIQTKKWKQREPEFTYNGVTYYRGSTLAGMPSSSRNKVKWSCKSKCWGSLPRTPRCDFQFVTVASASPRRPNSTSLKTSPRQKLPRHAALAAQGWDCPSVRALLP